MNTNEDAVEPIYTHVSVKAGEIVLPNTLGKIRASLPEDQREEFDREMYATPLEHIMRRAILGWAIPEEERVAADEAMERVRHGDLNGVQGADGNPGRPVS
ncbi:hypothetical protein OG948_17890 [Embleya sp. NBC_00888]|uniref:hypothetical protein n=1 Tax=Embleya sp. NBC_00888 TaxID=2975960 RepID=UPI003869CF3D|nr:hypothetical protein OG948_17890 [Embleya sp. NBC_00888]